MFLGSGGEMYQTVYFIKLKHNLASAKGYFWQHGITDNTVKSQHLVTSASSQLQ